jgi:hypothetical protein
VRSVHDNNIYAYSVSCDGRRIVLYTEYHEQGQAEYTDVIFEGVDAHHFQDQLNGNIILDIEDWPLDLFVDQNAKLFDERKKWGWPAVEYGDSEQLKGQLRERRLKAFVLSSSYGMSGWVLATEMKFVERPTRNSQF